MRKKLSWLLLVMLLILSVLSVNMIGVPPAGGGSVSAIYIDPASTVDTNKKIGDTYQISIKTNYSGTDIWGFEFTLTYYPCVLRGDSVANGDLIVNGTMPGGNTGAEFHPGTFDNTRGKLSLTFASFYYFAPPPNVTSGPGTLATVTFTVVGKGESDIKLGSETRLMGYDGGVYNIVDDITGNIEDGYFRNVDPAPTRDVAVTAITPLPPTTVQAGAIVDINVTVQNQGTQNETFYAGAYFGIDPNFYRAGEQLVSCLRVGISTTVTIAWNTTYVSNGTYTIKGTASVVPYETVPNQADNTLVSGVKVTVLTHDVAVTALTCNATNVVSAWPGDTVNCSVTIKNEGGYNETTTVTVWINATDTAINTTVVANLAPGQVYIWNISATNITAYPWPKWYLVKANATHVVNETDTIDNTNPGFVLVSVGHYDIEIRSVTVYTEAAQSVATGCNVTYTVEVFNNGDFPETFEIWTFANTTPGAHWGYWAGNATVFLRNGTATNVNLTWVTLSRGIPPGNYTLFVNTTAVAGERDLADNWYNKTWVRLVPMDVAVTDLKVLFKKYTKPPGVVVDQGYKESWNVTVEVTVKNLNNTYTACFNLTLNFTDTAGNNYEIGAANVTSLAPGASLTLQFNWTLADVKYCMKTLNATATFISRDPANPLDYNVTNNSQTTNFKVKAIGDVDNDGTRGVLDVINVFINAGPSPPKWVQADVDGDCSNGVLDVIVIFINAGPYKCD